MDSNFYENSFYDDQTLNYSRRNILKNNKVFLIIFMLLLILVGYFVYRYISKPHYDYSLDISGPHVVYMNETSTIVGTVTGSDKYKDRLLTFLNLYEDDVISLSESDFSAFNGTIVINPISIGKETIHATTIVQNENSEYGIEVAKKDFSITVCPAFDNSLLQDKNIRISNNSFYDLNIDFGEEECAKDVSYASSDSNIVIVDGNGKISSINKGKANLIISKQERNIVVPVIVN